VSGISAFETDLGGRAPDFRRRAEAGEHRQNAQEISAWGNAHGSISGDEGEPFLLLTLMIVVGGIEVRERGDVQRKLISENDPQRAHRVSSRCAGCLEATALPQRREQYLTYSQSVPTSSARRKDALNARRA